MERSGPGVADTASPSLRVVENEAIKLGLLDDFIGYYLRLAYEEAFQDFTQELGADSLKPGSFALLSLIVENPGITQTELSRAAGRDKSSVTTALRLLEDDGLIERRRLPDDRRSYASEVTAKGQAVYGRIAAKAKIHSDRLETIVGADDKNALLRVLKTLIVSLRQRER
ncbi:MarR family winged helix-turn-helix transcriptional regulator [Pararhizobium haloflavum]|uniref:MarR family winged helix-turn-helix transcriptional regulator n=1 Tax=Pararhizobium haloflavum TaxID=2037914 RepID=UPI000C19E2AD|nr:MarR family transcriptional regulator [Pararhizobium haloflavum]